MNVTREQVQSAICDTLNGENIDFPFELEPEEINNGSCDDFAQAICAYLDHPDNLATACATEDQIGFYHHVWLTLETQNGEVYFDSEIPEGTDSLENIPYFQRN